MCNFEQCYVVTKKGGEVVIKNILTSSFKFDLMLEYNYSVGYYILVAVDKVRLE